MRALDLDLLFIRSGIVDLLLGGSGSPRYNFCLRGSPCLCILSELIVHLENRRLRLRLHHCVHGLVRFQIDHFRLLCRLL
jgi:hypothetical protein